MAMILLPGSYLTSHIYFMLFLSLSCVAPPHISIRDSLFPHWLVDDDLPAQKVDKVALIILIPCQRIIHFYENVTSCVQGTRLWL